MKIICKCLIVFLLFIGNLFPQSKGHLVIIGGGKKPKYVMEKIVQLAGGKDSKIVVIPMASSEPLESAKSSIEDFKEAGSENVDFVICDQVNANDDSTLAKLNGAKGIYFGGGDQS
ncbi:MAG: hypothetical protein N3A61_00555, partial [Ignavibacteria bacterium]|nr:hypothetical protein [Ignavibacteria bacterium]